jgi:hypothetical protein
VTGAGFTTIAPAGNNSCAPAVLPANGLLKIDNPFALNSAAVAELLRVRTRSSQKIFTGDESFVGGLSPLKVMNLANDR